MVQSSSFFGDINISAELFSLVTVCFVILNLKTNMWLPIAQSHVFELKTVRKVRRPNGFTICLIILLFSDTFQIPLVIGARIGIGLGPGIRVVRRSSLRYKRSIDETIHSEDNFHNIKYNSNNNHHDHGESLLKDEVKGIQFQLDQIQKDGGGHSYSQTTRKRVYDILRTTPLIDGHNDLMWNIRKFIHNQINDFNFTVNLRTNVVYPWTNSSWSHTDIPRLRHGRVGAQLFAAYCPCEAAYKNAVQITLEQIDLIKRFIAKYPDDLVLALSADDIERAHKDGKIASLISVEGGHAIGNSLATLRMFYHLGVRSLTLTHQCNNPWADSSLVDQGAQKPQHGGLTEFGRSVVREMNRLGMLVDLSHTSKMTMKDAMNESQSPVIFSHSSAFSLCNHSRNVPDDILKELVFDGGIIMVTFYNFFITCKENATVRDVADHINYIRDLIGPKHIGIGAGFDGINKTPKGLEDASMYPNLFMELAKSPRWTDDDLRKLAGQNFLKVFREAEHVRDSMKKNAVGPLDDLISPQYLQKYSRCQYNISSTTPAAVSPIH